jgi:hypothetical protein
LENGKKHLAVLLAKGKLNTLQQFSKRLEDFLEGGATTDDILNSLTHLNGYSELVYHTTKHLSIYNFMTIYNFFNVLMLETMQKISVRSARMMW